MTRNTARISKLEKALGSDFEVVLMTMTPDLCEQGRATDCKGVAIGWPKGQHTAERQPGEGFDGFRSRAEREAVIAAQQANPGPIYLWPSASRV